LDEELLLRTLSEVRCKRADVTDHPQEIPGRKGIPALLQRGRRGGRDSIGLPVQHDRQLRAQNVGESRKKNSEVATGVRQLRHRAENLAGAMTGDDVEDGEEFVLGDQPKSFAHALAGYRSVSD